VANTGASVAGEALEAATDALAAAGIGTARLDAEVLLEEATGIGRASLLAVPERQLDGDAARRFAEMVRRRLQREPVAYIVGRKGFRNLELKVDRRALIPRPETELLVELALEVQPLLALDIGTGSGALALAMVDELPICEVIASDTSPAALTLARENAVMLGLGERVRFIEGSWPSDPVRFDLVVANLPYIPEGDSTTLQPEVVGFEPHEALFAGPQGLDAFEWLASALAAGEFAARVVGLEVGIGQAATVAGLMRRAGATDVEIRPDLAGIDRVVVSWWGGRDGR